MSTSKGSILPPEFFPYPRLEPKTLIKERKTHNHPLVKLKLTYMFIH